MIQSTQVISPPNLSSLQEYILFLSRATGLIFKELDENYIAIYRPKQLSLACGYLYDELNQKPVSGVIIQGADQSTLSDEKGYFELKFSEKDSLLTTFHLAYKSKILSINNECQTYLLEPSITELDEVIIEDFITEGINKISNGATQIDFSKVNLLPGISVNDVLHTSAVLPGIINMEEKVSLINIRGGSSDQSLVVLDGVKVYMPGHFFGLISSINPLIVDRTEIYKNGTPAFWTDGASGTIAIYTEDDITDSIQGSAGLNLLSAYGKLKFPIGRKSAVHFSTRRSYADVFLTPTFQSYYNQAFVRLSDFTNIQNIGTVGSQTSFIFDDLNLKILSQPTSKDKIRFTLNSFSNNLGYEERELRNGEIISRISQLKQENLLSGFSYDRLWSNRFKTDLFLYLSNYDLRLTNFNVSNSVQSDQINQVSDRGLKLNSEFFVNERITFNNGFQASSITVSKRRLINSPDVDIFSRDRLRSYALFSEAEYYSLDRSFDGRFGIRSTFYDKLNLITVEPRLLMRYQWSKTWATELMAERKNQSTTQIIDEQFDFLAVENRKWDLANNTDLPLIISDQLSIGLSYHKTSLLISSDFFIKNVAGISSSSQGMHNQFTYERASGSYQAKGAEVLINPRLNNFDAWISYTLMDVNYFFSDFEPQSFRSNFDIRHNGSIGFNLNLGSFELSSSINVLSGRPFTTLMSAELNMNQSNPIQYSSPNDAELRPYLRIDTSLKYEFKIGKFTDGIINLSLWNIGNRRNELDIYYQIANDKAEPVLEEGLQFTPNINLQINF